MKLKSNDLSFSMRTIICKDVEDFKSRARIFKRDMEMQNIKVSFKRKDDYIICPETGHKWTILRTGEKYAKQT